MTDEPKIPDELVTPSAPSTPIEPPPPSQSDPINDPLIPSESGPDETSGLDTLAIDIGGTGLKAAILDAAGAMKGDRVRVPTPYPCSPEIMVDALAALVAPIGAFDRISIGFPGVVRQGKVLTAPHFGTEIWRDFPLADAISNRLGRPSRLLNDAEVQGFGVIAGKGLELVLTLGTGAGTALFRDGKLMPHLELAHHPVQGKKSYNDYIGDAAFKAKGSKGWNRRVRKVIAILESLLHYDHLYLGGGNAGHVKGDLPDRVSVTSNDAGLTGGFALWRDG